MLAALSGVLALGAAAATRPHYGGTLRVEIRESFETPDPPQTGPTLAQLPPGFAPAQWDAPRHAVYSADDKAPGGRPFLDAIEIQMGRRLSDQSIDLDLDKADLVEIDAGESRRNAGARGRTWASSPVRLLVLVFGARIEDARIREALALAVDRTAIHNVLLQRQGEISGGLLPQWLSGYAFLFPAAQDAARARTLAARRAARRADSLAGGARPGPPPHRRPHRLECPRRGADALRRAAEFDCRPAAGRGAHRIFRAGPRTGRTGRRAGAYRSRRGRNRPKRCMPPSAPCSRASAWFPCSIFPTCTASIRASRARPASRRLGEWRFENLWLEPPRP